MSGDTLSVGAELGPYVVESVASADMKLMSALMRDPNPIHFDATAVEALGLGHRTINQGPATISYLTNMLTNWAGTTAALRSLRVRLHGNVLAGDRVTCRGRVTAIDTERAEVHVDLEASVGETVVAAGVAVVSRSVGEPDH